jgi:hypothetical protein
MKITKILPAYVIRFEIGTWDVLVGNSVTRQRRDTMNWLRHLQFCDCSITPSTSQQTEKLAVSRAVKKFPVFYRNWQVLYVVTIIRHKTQCVSPPDETRTTMEISALRL